MRTTPEQICNNLKKEYKEITKIRRIVPIVFAESCMGCGEVIRFEPMWTMERPRYDRICGCQKCYPNMKDFAEKIPLSEAAWVFRQKPENVSIKKWAVMSGMIPEEEIVHYSDLDLIKRLL